MGIDRKFGGNTRELKLGGKRGAERLLASCSGALGR